MDMKKPILAMVGLLLVLLFLASYTVDQREKAIEFRFGEILKADIGSGLHFKIPFIETVKKFPTTIQTLNSRSERFLTGEKKYVLVDFFVKWRIDDVSTFYRATGGGRLEAAGSRLEDIMKDGLRNEFSRRTIEEALSEERDAIMRGLEQKSNEAAKQLGIDIIDVRVSRIDFPEQVSESVFERMRSERQRVAQDFRSRGQEEAEKIKAAADRSAMVIMAEAYKEAEQIRGEGDAQAAEIYANAYQIDSEFFAFYRSLDAYRKTLRQDTTMVLKPDSAFLRYFLGAGESPTAKQTAAKKSATTTTIAPDVNVLQTPATPAEPAQFGTTGDTTGMATQ